MAIEEPSVIAAASSAAKLISTCKGAQGFKAESTRPVMIGLVEFLELSDIKDAKF